MGDAGRGGGRTRVRAWAALTTYGGNIKQAVAVLVEQGLPAQGFEPEPEPEAEEQLGQLAWAKNWAALNAALNARRDANAAAERHLGYSPMFAAAFKGTPRSIVGLLAAKGVDVGWADENGMTALHRAAAVGHAEVVRALGGTHGADLNQRAKQQRRHSAARRKGRGEGGGKTHGHMGILWWRRVAWRRSRIAVGPRVGRGPNRCRAGSTKVDPERRDQGVYAIRQELQQAHRAQAPLPMLRLRCLWRMLRTHAVLDRWLEPEKPHALNETQSEEELRVCTGCHEVLAAEEGHSSS